ncbi:MAG: hypothetical protein ACKOFO_00030, partial [Gemmatimonadota bacterium]
AAVVALAASDGRGAVVLPLDRSPEELAAHCAASDVGAVFTLASHRDQVPASLGVVLLDAIPRTAMVRTPEGREQMVDLGSHVGLTIEGETDLPGRDEEALLLPATSVLTLTHRALLDFDGLGVEIDPSRSDAAIVTALLIPLLAGRTLRVAS